MLSALREVVANKKDVTVAHSIKISFHELYQMLERCEKQMLLDSEDIVKTNLERRLKQEEKKTLPWSNR